MSGYNPNFGNTGYIPPAGFVNQQQSQQMQSQMQSGPSRGMLSKAQIAALSPQQKKELYARLAMQSQAASQAQGQGQQLGGADMGIGMGMGGMGGGATGAFGSPNMTASPNLGGGTGMNAAQGMQGVQGMQGMQGMQGFQGGGGMTPDMLRLLQQQQMQHTGSATSIASGAGTSSPQLNARPLGMNPMMGQGQGQVSLPNQSQQFQSQQPQSLSQQQIPQIPQPRTTTLANSPLAAQAAALKQLQDKRFRSMTPEQHAMFQSWVPEQKKAFLSKIRAQAAQQLGIKLPQTTQQGQAQTQMPGLQGVQGMQGMQGQGTQGMNMGNTGNAGLGMQQQLGAQGQSRPSAQPLQGQNTALGQMSGRSQGSLGMQQFRNLGSVNATRLSPSPSSMQAMLPNVGSNADGGMANMGMNMSMISGQLQLPSQGSGPGGSASNFAQSLPSTDISMDQLAQHGFTSTTPSLMQRTGSSSSNTAGTGFNNFTGFSPSSFNAALPGTVPGNNAVFGLAGSSGLDTNNAMMFGIGGDNDQTGGGNASGMIPFTQAFDSSSFVVPEMKGSSTSPQKVDASGATEGEAGSGAKAGASKAKAKAKGKGKAATSEAAQDENAEGSGSGSGSASKKPKKGGKKGARAASTPAPDTPAADSPAAESTAPTPAADSPAPTKPKPPPRKRKRPTAAEKANKRLLLDSSAIGGAGEDGGGASGETSAMPSGAGTAATSPIPVDATTTGQNKASSTPPIQLRDGVIAQWQEKDREAEASKAAEAKNKAAASGSAAANGKVGQAGKGDKEGTDREGGGPIHVTFTGIPPNEPDVDKKANTAGAMGPGSLVGADQPRRDEKRVGETRASTKGILRQDLSRLMYAAGDVERPRMDTVDMMEDMVAEFLGELCRPLPAIRTHPRQPAYIPKHTPATIRYRLARTPKLSTYLDRYDYLLYMDKLLSSAKRVHDPRPEDLVQDEELMADVGVVDGADSHAGARVDGADGEKKKYKRKPGPRLGAENAGPSGIGSLGMSGMVAGGLGGLGQGYGNSQDGAGEIKRKPGPKKGWKKEKMRQEAEAKKQGEIGVKFE